MIVTTQKPLDEILDFLSSYSDILIAGCDGCTQPPRGLREAKTLSQLLELGGKLRGKAFRFKVTTVGKQCDSFLTATTLKPQLEGVEAVLSLACGIGVQTITEVFPHLLTFPTQNTLFMGREEREGSNLEERCSACGDCILSYTGGICPITRCAKGLLNGPCGGTNNGKCEVDPEKDCAWTLIYQRLEKQGRLDLMQKIYPPRNFQTVVKPGKVEA
jgi:hypothetical protein